MIYQRNDWQAIRAHYAHLTPLIMAEAANEWADDAYSWCEGHMMTMTPIENWLWADIRANAAVLYPQYPVFNFFLDFANPKAKVAIECDGAAFHTDKATDAARDKRLTEAGWSVYRISGSHCRLESDEETGAPSIPYLFIRAICERHDISRKSQAKLDDDPFWFDGAESVIRFWERAREERERRSGQ